MGVGRPTYSHPPSQKLRWDKLKRAAERPRAVNENYIRRVDWRIQDGEKPGEFSEGTGLGLMPFGKSPVPPRMSDPVGEREG